MKHNYRHLRRTGIGTGTTSLLVIFTLLCMATLALLSMSTAAHNQRTSNRGVENTVHLAAAEGAAAQKLAELDNMLYNLQQELALYPNITEQEYQDSARNGAKRLGCEVDPDTNYISFSLSIDEQNRMVCEIALEPKDSMPRYRLVRQDSELTVPWTPEPGPSLWGS